MFCAKKIRNGITLLSRLYCGALCTDVGVVDKCVEDNGGYTIRYDLI